MVEAVVTYAAPHHLVSDQVVSVRRTRSGDAWEARQGRPEAATSGTLLGLPTVGVPAPLPAAEGCSAPS